VASGQVTLVIAVLASARIAGSLRQRRNRLRGFAALTDHDQRGSRLTHR
jgi:hypothetical protein